MCSTASTTDPLVSNHMQRLFIHHLHTFPRTFISEHIAFPQRYIATTNWPQNYLHDQLPCPWSDVVVIFDHLHQFLTTCLFQHMYFSPRVHFTTWTFHHMYFSPHVVSTTNLLVSNCTRSVFFHHVYRFPTKFIFHHTCFAISYISSPQLSPGVILSSVKTLGG